MDFNYLRYSLRSFLDSDFKREEISDILNAKEPEKFSRAYLKSLNFKEENEGRDHCNSKQIPTDDSASNVICCNRITFLGLIHILRIIPDF